MARHPGSGTTSEFRLQLQTPIRDTPIGTINITRPLCALIRHALQHPLVQYRHHLQKKQKGQNDSSHRIRDEKNGYE
jgi:hypothetical protein